MRIVLAEDHVLLRDGLIRALTDHDFEIVAAVDNGPALRKALLDEQPDVAVVDIRLPPSYTDEGLQAVIETRRSRPNLPVLVLSQYVEPLYARELLTDGTGSIGYLLKDRVSDSAQFIDAVSQVAAGGTAMDPQVISRLLVRQDARGSIGSLTERERAVLELMAAGRSNTAIAAQLYVSESAVAKHTANIFTKLELPTSDDDNRRVLAVLAYLNN